MFKTLALWSTVCVLTVFSTGCWDSTEINQLAIVTASACDAAPQTGQGKKSSDRSVLASVQIALPNQLQGSQSQTGSAGSGGQGTFIVETEKGPSPASALLAVQKRLSRRFFLADRRVIIIGEAYARQGISALLDEMVRNPTGRLRVYILVAHHARGLDLLGLNYPLNRVPADAILELEDSRTFVAMNLVQFIKAMTDGSDAYAMGIKPHPQKLDHSAVPFTLDQVAVFRKDRLVGWLSKEETKGFYTIYEQANQLRFGMNVLSVPGYAGLITSKLTHIHSSLSPVWRRHTLAMNVHVKMSYQIIENNTSLNLDHAEDLRLYERQLKKQVQQQIAKAISALQHKYDADCLQFGKLVHERYPRQWHSLGPRWHSVWPTVTPKIHVDITVPGSGNLSDAIEAF